MGKESIYSVSKEFGKSLPNRMFHRYLARWPFLQSTPQLDSLTWLFNFQSYASHVAFTLLTSFLWVNRKLHLFIFEIWFFANLSHLSLTNKLT